MHTLVTKLQYRDYEPGEFTDRKERTLEDTLSLIDSFPWSEQRRNVSVSITNPSVTIEGSAGDYLKLAIYYNGQFVLYYLDTEHHLYTCKCAKPEEATPFIRAFFGRQAGDATFDLSAFHREHRLFQSDIMHFEDASFTYKTNQGDALWVPFLIMMLPALLFVVLMFYLLISSRTSAPSYVLVLFLLIVLFLLSGAVILTINHWKASRGKALILSRGKDIFYYGPEENPVAYNKKDILKVVTVGIQGRYGYPRTTQIEIDFLNGSSLYISCLLLRHQDLIANFPNCPKQAK
ncbi:MAG: hypothetical protein JST39_15840, partial [Bacteroidetes bacterium]|nr:hypothetical protein [Bacteroidota bacterium]